MSEKAHSGELVVGHSADKLLRGKELAGTKLMKWGIIGEGAALVTQAIGGYMTSVTLFTIGTLAMPAAFFVAAGGAFLHAFQRRRKEKKGGGH